MILLMPALLLGLAVLPLLWWLLRSLPPPPRPQLFPAIRLLDALVARSRQPRRAPLWLLVLRLCATALLVVGMAQPVWIGGERAADAPGNAARPLLLAVDNGWAAASDWTARLRAVRTVLDRANRAGRPVQLLLTAPDAQGSPPAPGPVSTAAIAGSRLDGLQPQPWPVDRAAAAAALRTLPPGDGAVYVADGLATAGDAAFGRALRALGPVRELRGDGVLAVPGAPRMAAGAMQVPVSVRPDGQAHQLVLRGETASGDTLLRAALSVPAGADRAEATLAGPAEQRNRIARLVLDGVPAAGGTRLLDELDRQRPVGLLSVPGGGDTPLLGALFFLRRALAPVSELREGDAAGLLSRALSVLVAPDGTLDDPAVRDRVAGWVRRGGLLVRFAGPRLAARAADPEPDPAAPDPLLPVALLGGARQLGGAMSWGQPAHLAPFPDGSPFEGLPVPAEVTVSRQVLARPGADLSARVWATLADGTPLVSHAPLGDGQVVLVHVTANADWSSLPLSGLFPRMLQRLVRRAAGIGDPGADPHAVLAPVEILDADGQPEPPPAAARGLEADRFGTEPASVRHPAGFYGPPDGRRALNTGDALPPLAAEAPVGPITGLDGNRPDRPAGPALLVLALVLLLVDLVATLALRGLLPRVSRRATAAIVLGALCGGGAIGAMIGAGASTAARAADPGVPGAALETRLAFVVTGVEAVDAVSRQGLEGLGAYANARTSARLGHPDGVVPGRDDLAFYPMLYWPVTPDTVPVAPDAAWRDALNSYMSHGGILLIDTQGTDPDTRPAANDGGYVPVVPGTGAALRRATENLSVPPLRMVDPGQVLSRSFFLLHNYPGRYAGAPVWVAASDDLGNDGVSPLIVGANDWAAAWAVDNGGATPFAAIPGGEEQRVTAYRFGVNAVIYALTGNYKTDQVHVPALLRRLGE